MTLRSFERRDAVDAFATGLMFFLTFFWGLNTVAFKLAIAGFDPLLVSVLRSAIASVAVLGWCVFRRIPLFEKDGTFWPGVFTGLLFGAEFVCIFIAFDYTSVGRGSLMLNAMPFWMLIGAHLFLGEKMSLIKVVGVLLAFAGVYLVFSDRMSSPGPDAWIGDALAAMGGLLWAGTSLVIKSTKLNSAGPEKILLYQLVVSALMSAPLLWFSGPLLRDVTPLAVSSLLFQALFIVAFTYLLWFWLMRQYPASQLSSFAFLTPAFAVLMGGLLLGEPITWKIGAALAFIVAGLFIVNRPRRAAPAE